jgi:3-deoxy-D-manno-octulosonic-acid transferase
MGLIYRLAPIAFVGGSLSSRGGQNPIEPARLGRAVLHGPEVYNFADVDRELDREAAALAVDDADALATAVADLLADPARIDALVDRAEAVVSRSTGALDHTMMVLDDWSRRAGASDVGGAA